MKYLKLTGRLHVGYTGLIGRYKFVDGVSVELIPENERIRIGGNIHCVEVNEDGTEGGNPSPAAHVVMNQNTRATLRDLKRQTETEKAEENVTIVMGSAERKTLLSREYLDAVASRSGIAGLREIASGWGLKSKSIPVIMQMIVDAQNDYVTDQTAELSAKGVSAEEIATLLTFKDAADMVVEPKMTKTAVVIEKVQAVVEPVVDAEAVAADLAAKEADALALAAASGDMAAALTAVAEEAADATEDAAAAEKAVVEQAAADAADAADAALTERSE